MPHETALRRTLGFWDLVLFGIVYMAPIAPFTMFGWVSLQSGGAVVPSFVLGAIGLGFTGLSYAAMVEAAPQAGSVYGFAKLAMGPFAGFVGGWAVILDYVLLASLCACYGALYLQSVVPILPVAALLTGFVALALVVNALGIRWSSRVDTLIAGLQLLVAVLFVAATLTALAGGSGAGGLTLAPLWPAGTTPGPIFAGTAIAIVTFLGFDAISTLVEEVHGEQPGRTVGRATLAALAIMLGLFVVVSWLLADLGRGLDIADPAVAALTIIGTYEAWLVAPLSLVVALAFGIGAVVTIHAGVSRLVFAMARDGRLPSGLAYVHTGLHVPMAAVVTMGLIIGIVAWFALANVDLLGGLVSFGAIVAFLTVNAAVIIHFGIRQKSRRWLRHWLAPAAGIVVLLWVLSGLKPAALEVGAAWLAVGLLIYAARRVMMSKRAQADA